jgi:NAD(P)-dependent dehydrogenase (short-subunit alcohol dehydrogenase family)
MAVLATGRPSNMFDDDLRKYSSGIRDRIAGRRILVLGGAGSIGSSTVDLLSQFGPASLHVVDQNENALAELVRDLRSRPSGLQVGDFQTLPIDCGSSVMSRFIASEAPYDILLNFAAVKHVRSEKDVCSLLQMFETNVLKPMKVRPSQPHGRQQAVDGGRDVLNASGQCAARSFFPVRERGILKWQPPGQFSAPAGKAATARVPP